MPVSTFRSLLAAAVLVAAPAGGLGQLIQLGKAKATPHVHLEVVADAEAVRPGGKLTLGLHFKIDEKWHIYWRNHGASGLPPSVDWALPDGFAAGPLLHPAPEMYATEIGATYVHHGEPVLLAEIAVPRDAPVGTEVSIKGTARWLVCQKSCLPGEQKFEITLPVVAADAKVKPAHRDLFAAARDARPIPAEKAKYVKVSTKLSVDRVRPRDKFEVALVLDVKKGHHIQSNKPLSAFLIPTQVFLDSVLGLDIGEPVFPKPRVRTIPPKTKVAEFGGRVVIRIPVEADNALEGKAGKISGVVKYQACTDAGQCFRPESVEWSVVVPFAKAGEKVSQVNAELFGADVAKEPAPGQPVGGPPTQAHAATATGGFTLDGAIELQEESDDRPLWLYIIMALAGGLFLNITPCVLPVIGIKILSFVQQAGEDPRRVTLINLVFAAGMISVFFVLASLAVFAQVGWGGLFQYEAFNIVMAVVVFAMGLSFFGVFEIPVPGWINNAGGVEREGLPGTFIKGVLATFLATPCAGPLMGVVLAWSVAQAATVTFLVWGCIGLGMASPYLLAAVHPGVVNWLPKPGLWMERVKQFMGFVLMATAVYFLNVLPETYVIWTAFFLVAVGLAAWMIGQLININSPAPRKLVVRTTALAVVAAMGFLSFGKMIPETVAEHAAALQILRTQGGDRSTGGGEAVADTDGSRLPWVPFTVERLQKLTAAGRTVLVDFTADWCLNCKLNELHALNADETKALIEKNRVACLLADYTQQSPEIKKMLQRLGSISVPLTAIFPAGRPQQVIPLRDLYTRDALLEALRKAGPSISAVAQSPDGAGAAP